MKKGTVLILLFCQLWGYAQNPKATNFVADGNQLHKKEAFQQAEAAYREALSYFDANEKALHNLGNTLYREKDYEQANQRFFQAQKNSTKKTTRHAAFHNIGNAFMQQKNYEKAVDAFKNALRNNPQDEETRYNYALAKELLEKQKQEQEQNQDQQDQNQNQDQDQDQQDNDQEGDQKDKPSDQGEDGDDKNEGKDDNKDNKDKDKEKDKDKDKKGDKDKDEKKEPQQPKRKPGQISPEQIKSLLDAMNQQEKNVQDKVNAQKAKGVPVKAKKDW